VVIVLSAVEALLDISCRSNLCRTAFTFLQI